MVASEGELVSTSSEGDERCSILGLLFLFIFPGVTQNKYLHLHRQTEEK